MPKAATCIIQALPAVASLCISVRASRAVENLASSDLLAESESAGEQTSFLSKCPLMYSQGNKELSRGHFQEASDRADWSPAARAAIEALERVDVAGRGVSWESFAGLSLAQEGKWIMQTPPAEVVNHSDGQTHLLDLLHKSVRCSRRHDPGCDQNFKLYPCEGANAKACPKGGTCRAFRSSQTSPEVRPQYFCGQPADAIVDRFYDVIVSARSYVDIVSLEMPDGHFLAAIRNALTYLQNARREGTVQVRLLFGHIIGDSSLLKPIAHLESESALQILLRDILPKEPSDRLRVVSGTLRYWPDSWTHAKIVAADGKRVIQGGINFWQWDYLEHDPVFDISMEVSGPAAAAAVRFADSLWEALCTGVMHETDLGFAGGFSYFPYSAAKLIKVFKRPSPKNRHGMMQELAEMKWQQQEVPEPQVQQGGSVKGITIGRMGVLGSNSADAAFSALLQSAQRSIKISTQDFGPPTSLLSWRYDYMDAICYAMMRGVEVQVMLSNPHFVPSPDDTKRAHVARLMKGLTQDSKLARLMNGDSDREGLTTVKGLIRDYGLGHTKEQVRERFVLRLSHIGAPKEAIERLHVFYLLEGVVAKKGLTGWGNHAKFFMVDDQVFTIGSQNLYACNLQEFSMIIDDRQAAQQILDSYWKPLWSHSEVIPGEQDLCEAGKAVHRATGNKCKAARTNLVGWCPNDKVEFCYHGDPESRCCCSERGVKRGLTEKVVTVDC